jgi:hypothetical protein
VCRCLFKIFGDQGQNKPEKLKYGSVIRLMHDSTGQFIVASDVCDELDPNSPYFCAFLKKNLNLDDVFGAQWIISSRYRLRTEGDFVRENDYIVLKSARYKSRQLTTVRTSNHLKKFDSLVGLRGDAFSKKGWQVKRNFSCTSDEFADTTSNDVVLLTGDFVKFLHQELRGYLFCRTDNGSELSTLISPVGRTTFKHLTEIEHNHAVIVRSDSEIYDPNSCLNVWQILPREGAAIKKIKSGSVVRLRHVLTGLFLCVRETTDLDCSAITQDSKYVELGQFVDESEGSFRSKLSVATTTNPDQSSLFHLHTSSDITVNGAAAEINPGSNMLSIGDSVFFVHMASRLMLSVGVKSARSAIGSPWPDFENDKYAKPVHFNGDVAILSETFRLEKVAQKDVEDILFAAKFLPLAKAAVTCLQLTPQLDQLYLPMFRHLNIALHTLVRWVLGRFQSDGCLAAHPRCRTVFAFALYLFKRLADECCDVASGVFALFQTTRESPGRKPGTGAMRRAARPKRAKMRRSPLRLRTLSFYGALAAATCRLPWQVRECCQVSLIRP